MSLMLQIVFILVSFVTFGWIIHTIRKKSLNIDESIKWILWSLFLLVFSIFQFIPTWISHTFGFISVSNFIFSGFIFFLYIVLFLQSIQISKLKDQQRELIQKMSIFYKTDNNEDVK